MPGMGGGACARTFRRSSKKTTSEYFDGLCSNYLMNEVGDDRAGRRRETADLSKVEHWSKTVQHTKSRDCRFEIDPFWQTQRAV